MLRSFGICSVLLLVCGLTASAQTQTAQKGTTPPGGAAVPADAQAGTAAPTIPGANDVVATVSASKQTHNVTKGEVANFLSRYPVPAGEDREATYLGAVDTLVNTALLNQYLARQNIPVTPAKIDEEIDRLKQQLKTEGQDLA